MGILSAVSSYAFFTLLSTAMVYYGFGWQRPRSFWTNYFVAVIGALIAPFLLQLFPRGVQMNFYSSMAAYSVLIFLTSLLVLTVLHKFYSQQEEI
jgi:uncharacterized membrane protein YeaQ/YmgE (transglycosylase-associated protein family)